MAVSLPFSNTISALASIQIWGWAEAGVLVASTKPATSIAKPVLRTVAKAVDQGVDILRKDGLIGFRAFGDVCPQRIQGANACAGIGNNRLNNRWAELRFGKDTDGTGVADFFFDFMEAFGSGLLFGRHGHGADPVQAKASFQILIGIMENHIRRAADRRKLIAQIIAKDGETGKQLFEVFAIIFCVGGINFDQFIGDGRGDGRTIGRVKPDVRVNSAMLMLVFIVMMFIGVMIVVMTVGMFVPVIGFWSCAS